MQTLHTISHIAVLAIGGVLLLMAGVNPAVAAEDDKALPGTACQPMDGSADKLRYGFGGATNRSSGIIYVSCPLVKDNVVAPIGLMNVVVNFDKASSFTNTCTVSKSSASGATVFKSANAIGAGIQSVRIKSPISGFSRGTFNLVCQMRANDHLLSYTWNEI